MHYQRARPLKESVGKKMTVAQRIEKNRKDKKDLVDRGCSHGILVFDRTEPIGWCQYGPMEELPRIDAGRKYRKISLDNKGKRLWRVTCFCVDRKYRNRGVASLGLQAALHSIGKKGGGLVEAYPATRRGALAVWFGTVSMFEDQGFALVAPFGKSNVLMRRSVKNGFSGRVKHH